MTSRNVDADRRRKLLSTYPAACRPASMHEPLSGLILQEGVRVPDNILVGKRKVLGSKMWNEGNGSVEQGPNEM